MEHEGFSRPPSPPHPSPALLSNLEMEERTHRGEGPRVMSIIKTI